MDWDDFRYLLAIADAGSLAEAGRQLKVTHSTVLRRLDAMEQRLQTRLFERLRSGYLPTPAGEEALAAARQMAPAAMEAERRIVGGDLRLAGPIRISTGLVMTLHLLPRHLARFQARHPGIELEVTNSRIKVDLDQREADVALRLSSNVPEHWIGRHLGDVPFRIYGLRHGATAAPIRPLQALLETERWITFERDATDRSYDRWMHAHVPARQVSLRVDVFSAALASVKAGMGVCLLPAYVAVDEPGIVALSDPIAELQTPLWLLTHPDLRRTARIQVFMEEVGDSLKAELAQILPRPTPA